ncbi:hypothetical protein SASPL_142985 [Salvia splendens]|uniref:THH1/TOM1/TOM3 domain-containing protein n=1 Tax=Salvia splendens TaxID=180675 RepID=A0A8X8WMH4_SALSN|nr:hypothetical protein SASPL_142985 [Salvia splendens]
MVAGLFGLSVEEAVVALHLKAATNWWDIVNHSAAWQDRIFHVLAALYGIVAAVALVQLVRIQLRVPEYGWTTQKVFHFLNFLVNGVRCLVFAFRRDVEKLDAEITHHILLDLPSLAFFTTYALLVLFWAEIYYQARAVSTDGLRPTFYTVNGVVYFIQNPLSYDVMHCCLIALLVARLLTKGSDDSVVSSMVETCSCGGGLNQDVLCSYFSICCPGVSSLWWKGTDDGMVVLGYRVYLLLLLVNSLPPSESLAPARIRNLEPMLFLMLQRFPVESKGRRKKLQETCFDAFDPAADLDLLDHPILNFIYYLNFAWHFILACNFAVEGVTRLRNGFAAGGDIAVSTRALHIEKTASETRDHTVSSYQVMKPTGDAEWRGWNTIEFGAEM